MSLSKRDVPCSNQGRPAMSILEIRKFKDPVLKKRAKQVKEVDEEIKKLITDMIETMKQNQGIGLAAPQVGVLKRVIVFQAVLQGQQVLCLINPKIIKKSREKEKAEEGCLSFPNIFLEIKRAKLIEVEGLDIQGKKIKLKAQGFLARVIQHETDHLNGILFYNRLSFFKRIKYKLWT